MQLTISADDDALAISSLFTWLRRSPLDLEPGALTLDQGGDGSRMGAADIVNVVLSNAIGLGSLLVAFGSWRQTRRGPTKLTFTFGEVSVVVDTADREAVEALERLLRNQLPPSDDAT